MVVRTRLRAILLPVILSVTSATVSSYFLWNGVNGGRGLKAKDHYKLEMSRLEAEYNDLSARRKKLEHEVAMMAPNAVDRDLLEEQALLKLDFVRKSDLVIFLNQDDDSAEQATASPSR